MKILQVIPYFCFGGAEIMCENLCMALQDQGHAVSAVSLYDQRTPIAQRLENRGVPLYYLDKKLGLDLSMIPKLTSLMKRLKPDAVHTHLDVIKYAALAAKLAGIPACVHTVHSLADKEAEGPLQKYTNMAYFHLGWSVSVALSPQVRDSIAAFYGLKAERIPVIANGIDLSRCVPKTDYAVGQTINLVHVGRFDTPKNHPGLLRTFQKLHAACPACRLTLVGDGDTWPDMAILARELGIGQWVRFAGMQADVHPYLQQADIFVLPSIYEGSPMTVIEAMATGLPIAATAVGGIPDMLENEKNALLTSCDEDAIFRSWLRLAQDGELRQRLGRQALGDSARFSAAHMAESYCRCYGAT